MPAMFFSPSLHCFSTLALVPTLATAHSYLTLAKPRSSSTPTIAGDRAPRSALDAARVAHGRHWPRAAQPLRTRPGPPVHTLSTAVTPRRSQTRAQPRPVTAGAGDDDLLPYAPRPSWKQCDPTKPPPTKLSLPLDSPGPVEHRHDHA
jgi:hypothetical protein